MQAALPRVSRNDRLTGLGCELGAQAAWGRAAKLPDAIPKRQRGDQREGLPLNGQSKLCDESDESGYVANAEVVRWEMDRTKANEQQR